MYCLVVPFYWYANSILLRSQDVTSLPAVAAVFINCEILFSWISKERSRQPPPPRTRPCIIYPIHLPSHAAWIIVTSRRLNLGQMEANEPMDEEDRMYMSTRPPQSVNPSRCMLSCTYTYNPLPCQQQCIYEICNTGTGFATSCLFHRSGSICSDIADLFV